MQITYEKAMSAGRDAGNRQMRKAGRSSWSLADRNLAAKVANKLLNNQESRPTKSTQSHKE